jgi:hypothetical protein
MPGLRRIFTAALAAVVVAGAAATAAAKVFLAKDEALALAFPDADRVDARSVLLTAAQKAAVEERTGAALESQLWTIYEGWRGTERQGYALIDNHVVRTLPEAVMVVLDPSGRVRRVEVLAFYEPPEYQPSERWIDQFEGRRLDDELALRRGIQGITGATMSAVAMTAGVRRMLAIFEVVVRDPAAAVAPAAPTGTAPSSAASRPAGAG